MERFRRLRVWLTNDAAQATIEIERFRRWRVRLTNDVISFPYPRGTPMAAPIVLQLAPLPRTQIGPYLILGVDKDANKEAIEAAWAEKIKQARRGQIKTPLEDIYLFNEMLTTK